MDETSIIINNQIFKQIRINNNYYINESGDVYSVYANKIIKQSLRGRAPKTYKCIDVYYEGKQRHIPVHRLVYDTWVEPITKDDQINHRDDNPYNNHTSNLYKGSQKENIKDCAKNEHRVGNMWYLTIKDKERNKVLTFIPAKEFINYCGHSNKSGSLNKFFSKNWFKKRYEIVEFKKIQSLSHLKSVTTTADECRLVG